MKKYSKKSILVLTGLPFRKVGNQSLLRFIKMFIKRDVNVVLFSSGSDTKGENVLTDKCFTHHQFWSLQISFTNFLNNCALQLKKTNSSSVNYFETIRSEDVIPPYGGYNVKNLITKWIKFFLYILDNIMLFIFLVLFHSPSIVKSTVVVGYESAYTLCSKWIARLYGKNYINKFQGTILVATNRDKTLALKYFPHNYFSLNSSDLCIMVQDGTDGKYYAESKGCDNIFFEPHGVLEYKNKEFPENIVNKLHKQKKFVLVNIASGSTWKRTDRIVRSMYKIPSSILKNIVLVTTYHAQNKLDLVEYTRKLGLEENVIFLEGVSPDECNYMVQKCDISIMTNDFSNLGNPILESIYYKTPIISIDDGSLEGFIEDGESGFLIKLDKNFDENMASAIVKLYKDDGLRKKFRNNLNKDSQVRELSQQQDREFKVIEKMIGTPVSEK
jgi:glycosyltransferase involved in cell wall biosynthesis